MMRINSLSAYNIENLRIISDGKNLPCAHIILNQCGFNVITKLNGLGMWWYLMCIHSVVILTYMRNFEVTGYILELYTLFIVETLFFLNHRVLIIWTFFLSFDTNKPLNPDIVWVTDETWVAKTSNKYGPFSFICMCFLLLEEFFLILV